MIHLHGNLYLDADDYGYVVGTLYTESIRSGKDKGTERQRLLNVTYHPSISMAIQHVCQKRLRDAVGSRELQSLQDVARHCRELNDELKEMLASVTVEGERRSWATNRSIAY